MRSAVFTTAMLSFATPGLCQDPVKVDPVHHKVEIDNAQVRVLRITLGAGDKTPPHDHPAGFAIFLTDARHRVSPEGGTANEDPRNEGDVMDVPAGKHTVENLGTNTAEVLLVELKNPAMAGWKAGARDAAALDPKHYRLVGENGQARALRVSYGPNEKSVMHEHPPNVAVFLSDGRVTMGLPDGKAEETVTKRGAVLYSGNQTHAPRTSSDPVRAVVVELKGATGPKP